MTDLLYAGVGSRETPLPILEKMESLAYWLASEGWYLRTGGAKGADTAFYDGVRSYSKDYGCDHRATVYVPWENFNEGGEVPDDMSSLLKIAELYHPAWYRVGNGGRLLHARNVAIVLGTQVYDPLSVSAVICWTKDGEVRGGTGQAMRIALDKDIPIFNLAIMSDDDVEREMAKVKERLK